ncbi:DUF2220 family protein [Tumebacillus sp. DT12]|uniref:DUF2220 family protein n=1 Tax=Tumebacillus lacus TaxID=2995335 RepID=A0ABT3WWW3_9BACL|nr:Wadjet anti-phage system protein JetD domain-containing protein [Tumebacillus lacus]MCX7568706.1 DUF2220 family protein [Tumebacillus lacus]
MFSEIQQFLLAYKKKTIELRTIQEEFRMIEYRTLAAHVQTLMADGLLEGMKDLNSQEPQLPKKYRVSHTKLQGDFFEQLRSEQVRLHPMISLDAYYKLGRSAFHADLPWIHQIDLYLQHRTDSVSGIPIPEASFHMVGDEKWLEEGGGEKTIKRLGLSLEQLGIVQIPEPLMIAVHRQAAQHSRHRHLIIENKTPFHALLQGFHRQTFYTTMTFGRGKTILSNIGQIDQQTGLDQQCECEFYYFGDLDYEGIGIWYSLFQSRQVQPALELYRELLKKRAVPGKEHHRVQAEALQALSSQFGQDEAHVIQTMLGTGHYLPQEAVTSREWGIYWEREA